MQPCPSYVIAAQAEHTLHAQRVRPIFLTGEVPHGMKSEAERLFGVLKDGSSYDRCSVMALSTLEQCSPYRPNFFTTATRTTKAFRPTYLKQVVPARFFRRKTGFEFHEGFGIVFHTPIYYSIGGSSVKRIPLKIIIRRKN